MTTPIDVAAQTAILSLVLDRCHDIHIENKTVYTGFELECHRYYPRNKSIGALPAIVPVPGEADHNNIVYGSDILHSPTTITLNLFVDNFMAGSGPEWAQKNAELCIEHLLTTYWNRPRLETEADGALQYIMEDARLTHNGTIEVANESLAIVRFTLIVELVRDIERI